MGISFLEIYISSKLTNWLLRYGHLNIGGDARFGQNRQIWAGYILETTGQISTNWKMIVFSPNNNSQHDRRG